MINLDELIKQGESFTEQIKFVPPTPGVIRLCAVYRIEKRIEYEEWKATTLRFIRVNYPNDKSISEFENLSSNKIAPNNHTKILAIIKALNMFPHIVPITNNASKSDNGVTINVHQSQMQNQKQQIVQLVFIDAIKDELTGKQLKEIKEIIVSNTDKPEEAKFKIIEKMKSFGENVMSNILASIITNPHIFDSF